MLESLKQNEAFTYKKLSKEEMEARGILGRLVGPCAEFTIPTRNGRKYNEELWDKVFEDDIVNEKINNKCLFGELGHPADREEVDPEKIAIALNEVPKKNEKGQLIACFDILNTPSGKILKTLCDYGTTIGISSRGTGDIISDTNGDEIVDPNTYFFECFDAVIIPAVKSARLQYMRESLDKKGSTLKQALKESYDAANDEDKKIMKETLDSLDINLTEDDIPYEDPEEVVEEDNVLVEEPEDEVIEVEEVPAEAEVEITPVAETVGNFIDELKDYDKDLPLEWKPIVINEKEYPITGIMFDDSEEGKVIASVSYALPEEENTIDEVSSDDEPVEEAEIKSEEAVDNGDEEVMESFKDMVRQKDLLENEVRELKNQKTVSDAEVNGLKEELEKYKAGFIRVSELAAKSTKLDKENKTLNEQLVKKDTEIKDLKSKIENHTKLTESVNTAENKVKTLSERLTEVQADAEKTEKELTEQLEASRKKVQDRTVLAKNYKAKYDAILERYLASKASMLGVRTQDITSRLNENYSLDDIDNVCDDLLEESRPTFGLGITRKKATIQESVKPEIKDDGFKDLLDFAGVDYSDIE